jgi:hypothetical protein
LKRPLTVATPRCLPLKPTIVWWGSRVQLMALSVGASGGPERQYFQY